MQAIQEQEKLGAWEYGKVKVRLWDEKSNEQVFIGEGTDSSLWTELYDPSLNHNRYINSRYREGEIDDLIQVKINGKWYYTQNIDWE